MSPTVVLSPTEFMMLCPSLSRSVSAVIVFSTNNASVVESFRCVSPVTERLFSISASCIRDFIISAFFAFIPSASML